MWNVWLFQMCNGFGCGLLAVLILVGCIYLFIHICSDFDAGTTAEDAFFLSFFPLQTKDEPMQKIAFALVSNAAGPTAS